MSEAVILCKQDPWSALLQSLGDCSTPTIWQIFAFIKLTAETLSARIKRLYIFLLKLWEIPRNQLLIVEVMWAPSSLMVRIMPFGPNVFKFVSKGILNWNKLRVGGATLPWMTERDILMNGYYKKLQDWEAKNARVKEWIDSSIQPCISKSHVLWESKHGNASKVCTQKNKWLGTIFLWPKVKIVCKEIKYARSRNNCRCHEIRRDEIEEMNFFQFLQGLRLEFENVRSDLPSLASPPPIHKTLTKVSAEETRFNMNKTLEPVLAASKMKKRPWQPLDQGTTSRTTNLLILKIKLEEKKGHMPSLPGTRSHKAFASQVEDKWQSL